MKKIILLALVLTMTTAHAAIKCGEEVWVRVPGVTNGVFIGKLKATCTLTDIVGGDIRKLEDHFSEKALHDVTTRHSGPLADSSLGMNGEKYDVTANTKEGPMRSIIRVASDSKDNFRYVSESKEIKFTGMAAYMEKLDIDVTVSRSGNDFKVTLVNLTNIRKPGLAPAGMFSSIAQNKSKKEFKKNIMILAEEVAGNL